MLIFPAIDLFDGKAVRLLKGDYAQMTVYNENPVSVGHDFVKAGAEWVHLVDLEGAKSGETPNLETVVRIKAETGLKCEIGGGVRNMDTVRKYLDAGLDRVILGTAAVTDKAFLRKAVETYGEKVAVGADFRDGFVAIKGWTEVSAVTALDFCKEMESIGVKTLICTDISRDGAMQGTNHGLYETLSGALSVNITASGGVSSLDDVIRLRKTDIYGAIIGKAYYTGAISLPEAIEAAK